MCCKAKIAGFLVLLVVASPATEAADEESDVLAARGPKGQIFVVDGASIRCGDTCPLCGTGGCPVRVFQVKDGVTTNFYHDQALDRKITDRAASPVLSGRALQRAVTFVQACCRA
jgi:hypothetical protein